MTDSRRRQRTRVKSRLVEHQTAKPTTPSRFLHQGPVVPDDTRQGTMNMKHKTRGSHHTPQHHTIGTHSSAVAKNRQSISRLTPFRIGGWSRWGAKIWGNEDGDKLVILPCPCHPHASSGLRHGLAERVLAIPRSRKPLLCSAHSRTIPIPGQLLHQMLRPSYSLNTTAVPREKRGKACFELLSTACQGAGWPCWFATHHSPGLPLGRRN